MVVSVKKTSQVFDTFNPTHPNNIGCLSLPNLMVENSIMSVFQGRSGSFLTTYVAPCCYYGVYIGGFGC